MKTLKIFLLCFVLFSCNDNSEKFISPANPFSDFAKFLALIPEGDLPYELDFEDLNRSSKDLYPDSLYYRGSWGDYGQPALIKRNPFKSDEGLINKFIGPGVVRITPEVLAVFKFQPRKEQYAVVYAHAHLNRQWFFLQTFDNHGNKLRRSRLTGEGQTSILLSSINSQGIIAQREYEKIWKRDFETVHFENNEVIDHKLINIHYYKIDKNGHFKLIEDYCETDNA